MWRRLLDYQLAFAAIFKLLADILVWLSTSRPGQRKSTIENVYMEATN